jgi:hypothetical protein
VIKINDHKINLTQRTEMGRKEIHAWRKQGSIIRTVIENNPAGKRPLGISRLRWEDCINKDIERIEADLQWREVAEDRNRWRSIYLEG